MSTNIATHLHPDQGKIIRKIQRPSSSVIRELSKCYTGFVLDCLGKVGAMESSIKPISSNLKLCGPAVTCLGPDLLVRKMAIDIAEPGDVLVIAAGGENFACFGDSTANRMLQKGLAGVVIDGGTRDVSQIRSLGFPTFVKSVTPRNYYYPFGENHGAVNVAVVCGGVLVKPGDLIIGDEDGVIVIPREAAENISQFIVEEMQAQEKQRSLNQNKAYNVEEELRLRGYKFID